VTAVKSGGEMTRTCSMNRRYRWAEPLIDHRAPVMAKKSSAALAPLCSARRTDSRLGQRGAYFKITMIFKVERLHFEAARTVEGERHRG
jgi:hypothetical protein